MSGLGIAILMVFFKQEIFGSMHFLLVVPFLLVISMLIMYFSSLFTPAPEREKLVNTTFNKSDLISEFKCLKKDSWYKNYLTWAILLLGLSVLIWIVFS